MRRITDQLGVVYCSFQPFPTTKFLRLIRGNAIYPKHQGATEPLPPERTTTTTHHRPPHRTVGSLTFDYRGKGAAE